jgi:hypothetical protein
MLTTDWEPDERVLTATEPRLEVGYLDGRPVTAAARTVAGGCSASCPSAGSPTGFDRGREQPAIVVPCGKPRPAGGQPPGPKRPNSPPINVAMRSLRHRTQIWWLGSELL